jgi:phosphatidate cytidylyltransferase
VSNLTARVLVALVGIPVILLLAIAGGFSFGAFVLIVALTALHEYYALVRAKGVSPQVISGMIIAGLLVLSFLSFRIRGAILGPLLAAGTALPFPSMAQGVLILLLVSIPAVLLVELVRNKPAATMNVAATLFGAMYIGLSLGAVVGLRELFIPEDFPVPAYFPVQGIQVPPEVIQTLDRWGTATVMSMLAGIWVCDSAAYFAGRAFGKHRLFERVSPKKSWEGAIAGLIAAIGLFLLARVTVLPFLTVPSAIVCGAIVGVFGQIGDLAESLLKRDAGVKDSSTLIPGHGGVLDRFDSLLFVAPLMFVYLDFVVF